MSFTQFRWNGNVIEDVRLWAKANKQPLVLVRITQKGRPNPFTGLMGSDTVEDVEMPRCFYDSMRLEEHERAELVLEIAENAR